VSPKTNRYCQKLAQDCDLKQLEHVVEWQFVGKRPRDFVRRLLVLDEERRMSAKDAKQHWWFSNDFHRLDFEEVYHRASKHWRPRTLKTPIIEMVDADELMNLPMLQENDLLSRRSSRKRSLLPIDPPYKPYPRRMSLSLLPPRRPGSSGMMSDEIKNAILEKWSPEKMRRQTSDVGQDEAPTLIANNESDRIHRSGNSHGTSEAPTKRAVQPFPQRHSTILPHRTSEVATVSENLVIREMEAQAVENASCSGNSQTVRTTGKNSGYICQGTKSYGRTETSEGSESISTGIAAVSVGGRTSNIFHNAATANAQVVKCPDGKHVTVLKPSDLSAPFSSGSLGEDAREPNLGLQGCQGDPGISTPLLPRNSDSNCAGDAEPLTQATLKLLGRKDGLSMLRSPLQKSLDTKLRRLSKTKRRRTSVFDLDSDENSGQTERGRGTMNLTTERTNFRPSIFWKKARTGT
jgi:hypothetical protein